jgi:chromosomal replication initiation ATPase DnaA
METVSLNLRHATPGWALSQPLTEVLLNPRPRGFDTLAVVPSNVRAIECGLLFTNGLVSFAAVVGPSGWGKSHLLEAVANRLAQERGARSYELWSAAEWIAASRNRASSLALILDNVQDVLARPRFRQQLRIALERRVRAGWPTLLSFTESRLTRQIRSALPCQREWSTILISPPSHDEREVLVHHMANTEGVNLALELRRILAYRLEGNGRTLLGALKRLRLNGSTWITPEEILRACGLLNPFFAANSAWDLRDHIFECAAAQREGHSNDSSDLAVYAMLKVAQLCESDVARYLEIEPARAYSIAQCMDRQVRQDPEARRRVQGFVENVVSALQPV